MQIQENLQQIKQEIPGNVKIVAISKTKPNEDIIEAYEAGQRIFGENKAQELIAKQPDLPEDIEWHFVGHLQTNKVKYLAPFVKMIHSVDKLKLLKEVNKRAKSENRVIDCLLQFHIAEEESKFGLDLEEAKDLINSDVFPQLENVRITGVMGMATFTEDEKQIRKEFKMLKNTFNFLKSGYFASEDHFREISMGMTNDYQIAIEEGATIVRIGSAIFGERNY
ncbi:MAG: YggS family pyridoxal phosphate-dependent enzyme [Bacteroidales bacterium]|nr:YggS family pyridoxal phosphate-dependent enzyme [Bacteroidales bacterium]MCF8345038.1 YggS family pyridoxal phosphate-dependent enzyme [Bacteroidales bacterium]MCF8352653.1 YggS family pyridoxal phosphate-dependent enzyme [Bacteroidales bacterium]MCF8377206.1 YggS family pyridoxal phosphate-dependent enzyme [Bacteroidales bacterium]MCF8401077.1 YggS family pyridoxal phosphate-dependent enzyme [Bacteroidales bacterium]